MSGAIVTAGCCAAVLFLVIGLGAASARSQTLATPTYTDAQAKRGKAAYLDHCVSCHGDVAKQTVAERSVDHSMGFCVNCHREQKASNDCLTCHY